MKHTYKSMLFAAMALAAGTAGYFGSSSGIDLWHNQTPVKQTPAMKEQLAGLSPATIEGIKEQIARQEYDISFDETTGKLQSPNRRQNLRAFYKPGNLTVQNRVDSAGHNFKLQLVNEGIFADGKKLYSPQSDATPTSKDNQLLIEHDGFVEEFINTEDGVRQNFIIQRAPENTAQLQVRLSAKGLTARNSGENEIQFYREDANGFQNYVVYSDLHCWDANKKPLDATLAYVNDRVEINVAVAGAAYPVTIDPIVANGNPNSADKTIELDHSNAWLGYSVSSAGDVNQDGYSDVIVGAPKYDWNGEDAGVAYVFPGSATGILLTGQRLNRNQPFAQMGFSVASAGDINKDGYSDVIVGSPYWEDSPAQTNEGAAFVYYGGAISAQAPTGVNPGNFITLQSDQAEAGFGTSVAMAGDVNADGYSDFLVGAPSYDKDQANEGVAFLYYGSGNGSGFDQSKTEILEQNQSGSMMGYSVAGAGDVNGDGASDIIVGARLYSDGQPIEGAAFVYWGNVNSAPITSQSPTMLQMNLSDSRFGHSVATAGDVNGDGFADIIIGSYLFDNGHKDEGAAYIFTGKAGGIDTAPSTTLEGNQFEARYGESVSSAGDVNGDGYGDVLIGAKWFENGQSNEGAVFLHYGSQIGLVATPAATIESNQAEGWLGSAVASAGDVNGDGYSDIIIGCYTFDHGQNDEGQVFIYHGAAASVGPTPSIVSGSSVSAALLGAAVSSAGDIDGNGLDDIVVGAPHYDGGQVNEGAIFVSYGDVATGTNSAVKREINMSQAKFGGSVSGAGDVNGDGYADVIVGAVGAVNGVHLGAAYLYSGGPQGLGTIYTPLYKGNQGFGAAVSDAGDVNGDGFDDVIVGAPNFNAPGAAGAGAVYIFTGSTNYLDNLQTIYVTSGIGNTHLGNSLDNAGDINGDGYSDIIAGASAFSQNHPNEGAVFTWHGSSAGIPTNALYNKLIQPDQNDAAMGTSVASAGDVNGDGFFDVIVGLPGYSNGQNQEGTARVYYGSGSGLVTGIFTHLEANQADASFGKSVGGGIDVNGDSYDDVVVGAPNFDGQAANGGGVWVFHGSKAGVQTTASFSVSGAQVESNMGTAVAGAGDLNGDGYGDIVVGIPNYDQSGLSNGGVAYAYYGNNGIVGKNRRNNTRLYNGGFQSVMTYNQNSQNQFGAGLYGASFLGRNSGRLVWETVTSGNAFSKVGTSPITNSTVSTGQQQASYTLNLNNSDLREMISKLGQPVTRTRVRLKHDLSTALTGQVYGPWRIIPRYLRFINSLSVPELSSNVAETEIFNSEPEVTDEVVIFPNPVSDKLSIKTANADQIKLIQLISADGRMHYQSAKVQSEVDVKHLTPGSYLLVINRNDGSKTAHKVLIKK